MHQLLLSFNWNLHSIGQGFTIGGTVSGICTGVTSYSGWSQVGTSSTNFYDVRPKTSTRTTGIGSTARCRRKSNINMM